MKFSPKFALLPFIFSTLACRPVLTVGWTEIFIVAALFLILTAPALWRFWKEYRKYKKEEREK